MKKQSIASPKFITCVIDNQHPMKHFSMNVPADKFTAFQKTLNDEGHMAVLENMAFMDWPVNTFLIPRDFHPEMKALLETYKTQPLRFLLNNALINQFKWRLIVNLEKTHCPVYFQIIDDGVNDNTKLFDYIVGSFETTYAIQHNLNVRVPVVFIQDEVAELFTSTDNQLFNSAGSERMKGYDKPVAFHMLAMVDKYTKEEMDKFVNRRNKTLKTQDLNVISRGGNRVKTFWHDRKGLGFPEPRIACNPRPKGGWEIRLV